MPFGFLLTGGQGDWDWEVEEVREVEEAPAPVSARPAAALQSCLGVYPLTQDVPRDRQGEGGGETRASDESESERKGEIA